MQLLGEFQTFQSNHVRNVGVSLWNQKRQVTLKILVWIEFNRDMEQKTGEKKLDTSEVLLILLKQTFGSDAKKRANHLQIIIFLVENSRIHGQTKIMQVWLISLLLCYMSTNKSQTTQGNKTVTPGLVGAEDMHRQPSRSCLGSLQGSRVIPLKGTAESYQPTSLKYLCHTVKGLDFAQKRWYSTDRARQPWGLKVH